jgi:hypothetical protein
MITPLVQRVRQTEIGRDRANHLILFCCFGEHSFTVKIVPEHAMSFTILQLLELRQFKKFPFLFENVSEREREAGDRTGPRPQYDHCNAP